jgi:hypothetical protein
VGHFVPPLSVALHDVLACRFGVDRSTAARARTAFLVLYPRERGIAHLKNWRVLARHLGRRWHMSDTVLAMAGLLSHQQMTDLTSAQRV